MIGEKQTDVVGNQIDQLLTEVAELHKEFNTTFAAEEFVDERQQFAESFADFKQKLNAVHLETQPAP